MEGIGSSKSIDAVVVREKEPGPTEAPVLGSETVTDRVVETTMEAG